MRLFFGLLFVFFFHQMASAQFVFEGYINKDIWKGDVYLSIIEDYRQLEALNDAQIITKVSTDIDGYFKIEGNQLEDSYRFYKLHVNSCKSSNQDTNTANEDCLNSREIVFIAKNTDTISFPLSFNKQMFCDIKSNNSKTTNLFRIDSIKEEMMYAYSEFKSEANRKLNNKKWFKTLQNFGEQLNDPLAELYIYYYLSDRGKQHHNFYMNDLKENGYYDALSVRLEENFANTSYIKQYKAELASDRFMVSENRLISKSYWIYFLSALLILSLSLNFWFMISKRNKNKANLSSKELLTKQEHNILDLLLNDKTNKEIAEDLFVSVSTVKSHVNNIYKKFQVSSRQELKEQMK